MSVFIKAYIVKAINENKLCFVRFIIKEKRVNTVYDKVKTGTSDGTGVGLRSQTLGFGTRNCWLWAVLVKTEYCYSALLFSSSCLYRENQ